MPRHPATSAHTGPTGTCTAVLLMDALGTGLGRAVTLPIDRDHQATCAGQIHSISGPFCPAPPTCAVQDAGGAGTAQDMAPPDRTPVPRLPLAAPPPYQGDESQARLCLMLPLVSCYSFLPWVRDQAREPSLCGSLRAPCQCPALFRWALAGAGDIPQLPAETTGNVALEGEKRTAFTARAHLN